MRKLLPLLPFLFLASNASASFDFKLRGCEWISKHLSTFESWIEEESVYGDISAGTRQIRDCVQAGKLDADISVVNALEKRGQESEAAYNSRAAAVTAHYHGPESCSTVDLRSRFGEVRDQDTKGNCFAFEMADLLTSLGLPRVSAWDLALRTQKLDAPEKFEGKLTSEVNGGSLGWALDTAQQIGVCRESDFPSEFGGNKDVLGNPVSVLGIERSLEREALANGNHFIPSSYDTSCLDESRIAVLSSSANVTDILHVIASSDENNVVLRINAAACDKNRVPIPPVSAHFNSDGNWSEYLDTIDDQLNHSSPIAVNYDKMILYEPQYLDRSDPHTGTVVGRHFENGHCEYLVRNSFGKGCSSYPHYKCENGNVWIPSEVLAQAMTETFYIQKK